MTTLSIATANLDFALSPNAVDADLDKIIPHVDALVFQEAKYVKVDRLVQDKAWKFFQTTTSEAKKGTGIGWDTSKFNSRRRGRRIGTTPRGRALLTRYITWVNLEVLDHTGTPVVIRVASVHLPPKRFWSIYPFMVASIVAFARATKQPLIIGGDWNKLVRRDKSLANLAKTVNGRFYGFGIDGFLVVSKGRFKVDSVVEMRDTHSDHTPVKLTITV